MLTIEDVPSEVLEFVFSKLTLDERKIVRLVSKHWLAMCNSTSITKHEIIKLQLNDLDQFTIPRGSLNLEIEGTMEFHQRLNIRKVRLHENLEIMNIEECFRYHLQFWIAHGNSVRSIQLSYLDLRCPLLYDIINLCPNINALTLLGPRIEIYFGGGGDDDDVVMEGLSAKLDCLVSLNITRMESMKGADLSRFTTCAPKLKRLRFENVGWVDSVDSIREAIMSLILKPSCTLTELVFESCFFPTGAFLENILKEIGHQLTGLHLCSLSLANIKWLRRHVKKLTNLQCLELSHLPLCFPVGEGDNLSMFSNLRNLKFISFSATGLVNENLKFLVKLEHLKGLDISYTNFSADAISDGFGQKMFTNLIDLRMKSMSMVTDAVLANILPHLPNLKRLDLSFCPEISSQGVVAIITNCKQLTRLALENCYEIENLIEPISINCLKSLVHLNLFSCWGLDPRNVLKLRFENLKNIELGNVPMSEKGLKKLLKHCPKLVHLHLSLHDQEHIAFYDVVMETKVNITFDDESLDDGTIFDFSTH